MEVINSTHRDNAAHRTTQENLARFSKHILRDSPKFTTGLETAKNDPELKDIPIVVLSNLGEDKDVTQSMNLGARDYIIKSDTSLKGVIEKINFYLNKSS